MIFFYGDFNASISKNAIKKDFIVFIISLLLVYQSKLPFIHVTFAHTGYTKKKELLFSRENMVKM